MINLNDLIKEKKALELKLNALQLMIQAYTEDVETNYQEVGTMIFIDNEKDEEINMEKMTWLNKLIYILESRNRFMHNHELAEIIRTYYPDKSLEQVKRRISAVLAHANKNNKPTNLINYKVTNSIKDTVWGFNEWLNDKGEIKKEYMFFKKK